MPLVIEIHGESNPIEESSYGLLSIIQRNEGPTLETLVEREKPSGGLSTDSDAIRENWRHIGYALGGKFLSKWGTLDPFKVHRWTLVFSDPQEWQLEGVREGIVAVNEAFQSTECGKYRSSQVDQFFTRLSFLTHTETLKVLYFPTRVVNQ